MKRPLLISCAPLGDKPYPGAICIYSCQGCGVTLQMVQASADLVADGNTAVCTGCGEKLIAMGGLRAMIAPPPGVRAEEVAAVVKDIENALDKADGAHKN